MSGPRRDLSISQPAGATGTWVGLVDRCMAMAIVFPSARARGKDIWPARLGAISGDEILGSG